MCMEEESAPAIAFHVPSTGLVVLPSPDDRPMSFQRSPSYSYSTTQARDSSLVCVGARVRCCWCCRRRCRRHSPTGPFQRLPHGERAMFMRRLCDMSVWNTTARALQSTRSCRKRRRLALYLAVPVPPQASRCIRPVCPCCRRDSNRDSNETGNRVLSETS